MKKTSLKHTSHLISSHVRLNMKYENKINILLISKVLTTQFHERDRHSQQH